MLRFINYSILGLDLDSNEMDIRTSYIKTMRKISNIKYFSEKERDYYYNIVMDAYATLSNSKTRLDYNKRLIVFHDKYIAQIEYIENRLKKLYKLSKNKDVINDFEICKLTLLNLQYVLKRNSDLYLMNDKNSKIFVARHSR